MKKTYSDVLNVWNDLKASYNLEITLKINLE